MNKCIKHGIALSLIIVYSGMTTQAQLPSDYVTKVSFYEKKEVTYSLPSEVSLHCLSVAELAQYHGYMQRYTMDEYVDTDGDLLTDQKFIEEQNVRDEWMEGYTRITVGKETIDVYTAESGLRTQIPVEQDTEEVLMSNEQALNYGFLDLNDTYYLTLKNELHDLGLQVVEDGSLVSASNAFASIAYDHSTKTASAVAYDSTGLKTKESVIQYALNKEGETYYPQTETEIEWILGKNGCCIRKTTIYTRHAYSREVTQEGSQARKEEDEGTLLGADRTTDYEVHAQQNSDVFRIVSKKFHKKEIEIIVYDMAGKRVLHTNVLEGEAVRLPKEARAGMYLVHIVSKNRHSPVVGRVIKNNMGTQF